MSFLASATRFEQFQKFGKFHLGAPFFPATLNEKKLCTGSEFLLMATCICSLDLTSLAKLTLEINSFPKLGTQNLSGHLEGCTVKRPHVKRPLRHNTSRQKASRQKTAMGATKSP